jgi:hypothetical protein
MYYDVPNPGDGVLKIIFRGSTLYLKKNLHKARLIWSEELIT